MFVAPICYEQYLLIGGLGIIEKMQLALFQAGLFWGKSHLRGKNALTPSSHSEGIGRKCAWLSDSSVATLLYFYIAVELEFEISGSERDVSDRSYIKGYRDLLSRLLFAVLPTGTR